MRRIKPVTIQIHPNLYNKMEEMRKKYRNNHISLSQMELTNMISKQIKLKKVLRKNVK